jgi:hypothetical protein
MLILSNFYKNNNHSEIEYFVLFSKFCLCWVKGGLIWCKRFKDTSFEGAKQMKIAKNT